MMTAAEYRAKAAAALAQANEAAAPEVRDAFMSTAREWTTLAVTADVQEKLERDLL